MSRLCRVACAVLFLSLDCLVRLRIKGRDTDGWYPLSKIEISR